MINTELWSKGYNIQILGNYEWKIKWKFHLPIKHLKKYLKEIVRQKPTIKKFIPTPMSCPNLFDICSLRYVPWIHKNSWELIPEVLPLQTKLAVIPLGHKLERPAVWVRKLRLKFLLIPQYIDIKVFVQLSSLRFGSKLSTEIPFDSHHHHHHPHKTWKWSKHIEH